VAQDKYAITQGAPNNFGLTVVGSTLVINGNQNQGGMTTLSSAINAPVPPSLPLSSPVEMKSPSRSEMTAPDITR
jgi:hypothetical protein